VFQFLVFLRPCALQAQQFLASRCRHSGKGKWLIASLLCAALSPAAHAGRPMATDDAAVVDEGACQLEAWTEHAHDANTAWINPGCNPFGATEFALGAGRRQDRRDSSGNSTLMSWQVKHLLRAYDDRNAGFAVAAGGQHAYRSSANDIFIKGIATLPLRGEDLLAHVNLGALRQREDAQRDYRGTWGIALDAAVAPGTRASLETYGMTGGSNDTRKHWQLGLRHALIPDRLQLDASVGSPFGHWSERRVFTVGLVFVMPGLLR